MTGAGLLVGALLGAEAYPEFKHLLHSHELDRSGLILPRPIVFSAHSEIDKKVLYLTLSALRARTCCARMDWTKPGGLELTQPMTPKPWTRPQTRHSP